MILRTEEVVRKAIERDNIAKQREDLHNWIMLQKESAVNVDDPEDPTLIVRQLGRVIHSDEVERLLKSCLPPNIQFIFNQFNSDMKACYRLLPNNEREYLFAYNYGVLPEHSIRAYRREQIPDPNLPYLDNSSIGHLDRKDMPKCEWDENRKEWLFDGETPGFTHINRQWHEAFRGWRTILLRCVEFGLTTPNVVERAFGSGNRKSWAKVMGKSVN